MKVNLRRCHFKKLVRNKTAMAIPITFLILLVSTLSIVSFTYYFAVERVNTQGQTLKVSTAKQNILSLDDEILSTLGQPGSSTTFDLADSGGLLKIQPTSSPLTLSVSDNSEIQETIFDASIGKVTYVLPYSTTSDAGLYLKGDSRTIANQSGSSTTQLCIKNGVDHPEIQLHYRPTVTYASGGLENGKAVTNIRIYIVNLNSSVAISLQGELPLQIACTNTQLESRNYDVSYAPGNLVITSALDGASGNASVPISSTADGAVIHMEIVVSNISIQRWIR